MRWIVSLCVLVAACGGPQIPAHNGYKPKEAKPWQKAKTLKFDDKLEAKTDGDLSYPDMRRAHWYQLTLPSNGQLQLQLEVTPPGDAVNDDFDLGMEVYDPSNHVIVKSDLDDEDAHELTKKKTLVDLLPGKYLIHLYLEGRMDTCDFVFRASFRSTAAAATKSDYPAQVAFTPPLPMVPLEDETPKNYHPPAPPRPTVISHGHRPPPPPPPPPAATVSARVIGMAVNGANIQLTLGRGTANGANNGMKGHLGGVGDFVLSGCNDRTCSATVKATADQVKNSSGVATLSN